MQPEYSTWLVIAVVIAISIPMFVAAMWLGYRWALGAIEVWVALLFLVTDLGKKWGIAGMVWATVAYFACLIILTPIMVVICLIGSPFYWFFYSLAGWQLNREREAWEAEQAEQHTAANSAQGQQRS